MKLIFKGTEVPGEERQFASNPFSHWQEKKDIKKEYAAAKPDGFSVLENFRKENLDVPVLILSARDGIKDKVKGLDLGADDYLTNPFHFAELEARVRSLLRRKTVIENTVLSSGSLCFDTASRIATAAGHPVFLTTKENALLEYLLLHKGRVIKFEEVIEHVWDSNADTFSNSVRVHMSSLRRKFCYLLN